MKFSLWYDFRNPIAWRRPYSQLYEELLEQIEFADGLGAFEHVWLSEHHFTDDGYLPSLVPMMAAISQRTRALRIGSQVLLAPLHHPLRLAEDIAVVDHLSGGRIDLGLAPGYRAKEFEVMHIAKRQRGSRTDETLELLYLAWTGEAFSYHGRHYDFEDVLVTPIPAQSPVPIWIGGSSHAAARRAGRFGCHFMSDQGTPRDVFETYSHALHSSGHSPASTRISTNRAIYVCDDPERGWVDVRDHFLYVYNGYRRWYAEAGDFEQMGPPVDDPNRLPRELFLVGTPEMIVDHIRRQRAEVPFESVTFWAHPPGMNTAKTSRSLELFAHHVQPSLASD